MSSPLKVIPKKKRTAPVVFVAMSGGVDSSATAYLLKDWGFEVVGVYMKNWSFPIKRIEECPLYQDYKDMVKVCKFLKIPYQVWSFEQDYRKRVIDPFFKGYEAGLTPNPDIMCNTEIKFDDFLKKALKLGADYIATGHHIRSRCANPKSFKLTSVITTVPSVIPTNSSVIPTGASPRAGGVEGSRDSSTPLRSAQNDKKSVIDLKSVRSVVQISAISGSNQCNQWCKNYQLLKGKDPIKDQTYFVYRLTQDQLKKCIFPVGDFIKKDLRAMAKKVKLPTAGRRDSQGICFIGNINVKSFLKTRLSEKEGDIVTKEGRKIGKHEGAWFYTIGQRRIEGLSGTVKPLYVIGKDMKKNQVIVGDDKDTYSKIARLKDFHLINAKTIIPQNLMKIVLTAKSRYTPSVTRGKLGKDKKGYFFEFVKPERAITPGQSLVLYKGDICLGGGIITGAL
ncbi:MAG: tRNA 2-thiouridine(34) synthase MnmA [Patescibacteria group bacterium]